MQRKIEKDMDRLFLLSLTLIILGLAAAACGSDASPSPETIPLNPPAAQETSPAAVQPTPTAQVEATQTAEVEPTPTPGTGNPGGLTDEELELLALGIIPPGLDRPSKPVPEKEYEIITVLGFDAIPAILDPQFLTAAEAQEEYRPAEPVMGLSIEGDHRAYPIPFLSSHEIVNDVVGGVPLAVTW